MGYVNPLHPQIRSSQLSTYTSLGSATGPSTAFLSPTRRRLPQQPFTPTSKWDLSMGKSVRLHSAIQFDYNGYVNQGVQMRELVARSSTALASMIQGAGDLVLAHTGRERIMFRIIWPGYEHIERAYSLEIAPGERPITRAQLGVVISQHFARFVEKMRSEPSQSQWNLNISGIRFEHLVLVGLVNVWDGVWQAEVAVDLR
ncbi:hypothetical protein H0H87_008166 [Tephrocybe sp. NHM501043]|nr:hypothetical protein H0H87_008166 [Tephrocybe sp. NHM501043]